MGGRMGKAFYQCHIQLTDQQSGTDSWYTMIGYNSSF